MTSSLTGGRVKEPKVKTYDRPLHVDVQSYRTSGLSDAWSSYSRAKSSFNHVDSKLEDEEMESKRKRGVTRDKAPPTSISSSSRPIGVSHSSTGPDTRRQYSSRHTVYKSYSHDPFSSPVNSNPHRTSHSQSWIKDGTTNGINRVDTSDLLSSVYRGPSPSTRDIPSLSSNQPSVFNHRHHTASDSYSWASVGDPLATDLRPAVKPVTRKVHSKTGPRVSTTSVHTEPRINLPRETISSLQETIQKQKKEVDELKAKRLQLSHQRHTRELDYTVRSHDTPAPITMRSHDTPAPIKRRKIATAPPPKSYSGFTSTIQTTPTTHQTTPTTIKAPPPTRTSHLVSSILDNLSKPLPPHKPTTPPSREPRPPIITPSSWKTGQENVNRVLGKGPTLTNREASDSSDLLKHPNTNAAILLQDLEDSESEDEIDRIVKRRATGPSSVAVKLRRVLETSAEDPSKVVERHYDRQAVRRYMKSKEEDKKRKAREEREAQQRAQSEREQRLKDLQERQRQIVVGNLMHQKRYRELGTDDPAPVNYTGDEPQHYTSHTSPLSYSVPPSASYPVTATPPSNRATPTVTGVAHSFSSPVGVPISLGTTTPPQRTSVNLSFKTPPISYHPPSTDHLSPYTSSSYATPNGTPSITPHATPIHPTTRGSPILTPTPHTPVSNDQQARLLALKQSAIALREKINASKQSMVKKGLYSSPRVPCRSPPTSSPPYIPGVNNIRQHLADARARQEQDNAALKIQSVWKGYRQRKHKPVKRVLLTIPPLSSSLSPVRVQAKPLIQVTPPISRVTPPTSHMTPPISSRLTPPLSSRATLPISSQVTPKSFTHLPISSPHVATPIGKLPTSPWLKSGGDKYSIVNILTRRQDRVRQQLQDEEQPVYNSVLTTEAGNQTSYTINFDSRKSDSSVSSLVDSLEGSDDSGEDEVDRERREDTPPLVTTNEMSAITPPGSPSFSDSFSTPPLYQATPNSHAQGMYSPRALEMKLKAELNILDTVGEGVRQLEGVESTRAISLAQQETVALAQLLQSQKQVHQNEVHSVASKAKNNAEQSRKDFERLNDEASKMSERLKVLEDRSKEEGVRHAQEIEKVQAVSRQRVDQVTQQLLDSQSTAIANATQQQLDSAKDMAVSVAKAASEGAVLAALKQTPSIQYESDFEQMSSFKPISSSVVTPPNDGRGSLAPPTSTPTSQSDTRPVGTKLSPQLSGGSTRSQSLTPVPSEISQREEEEGDRTITEGGSDSEDSDMIEEEMMSTTSAGKKRKEFSTTEDVSEEISRIVGDSYDSDVDETISDTSSLREILPSESHRRQQLLRMRPSSKESPDPGLHPLSGDISPMSGAGEESFSDFMSRMLHQYVREEEMRAKHQAALLELREKAIKEKTDLQLELLKIKKGKVQKRGDDVAVPVLLKQEKGILKKLRYEQAEIQRLKEAQRAASQERKLLLAQQQDLFRIHRSARYYKDKIKRYVAHNSREPSPFTDLSFSPSPSPSISVSQEDIREQLSSLNTSPNKSLSHSTTSLSEILSYSPETTPTVPPNQTIPVLKSSIATNDSESLKLRHKSAQDAEMLLNKRSEQLIKKRKKAEDLLRTEQDILKRKKELDAEEERIAMILDQAKQCHKQIGVSMPHSASPIPLSHNVTGTSTTCTVSNVPEDISEVVLSTTNNQSVEYGASSFDTDPSKGTDGSLTTPLTSTPHTNRQDEEIMHIDELKDQLKAKEAELDERKLRHQQKLDTLKAMRIQEHSIEDPTSNAKETTPTKTGTISPVEAIETNTAIDEVLSPISSSASSASTVISSSVTERRGNDDPAVNTVSLEEERIESITGGAVPGVREREEEIFSSLSESDSCEVTEDLEAGSGKSSTSSPVLLSPVTKTNTGLVHIEQNVIAIEDPKESVGEMPEASASSPQHASICDVVPEDIVVGARVLVANKVEGTVQYIGETDFEKGVWIGVELDYEKGKNDGSVGDKRYFTCSQNYGLFAPPSKVVPLKVEFSSDSDSESHDFTEVSEEIDEIHESVSGSEKEKTTVDVEPIAREDNSDDLDHKISSDIAEASLSSETSAPHILAVDKNIEIPVDNLAEGLLQQLTTDAFNTVHTLWKGKEQTQHKVQEDEVRIEIPIVEAVETKVIEDREKLADNITDDLLKALVSSEVSVVCNLKSAKSPPSKVSSTRHKSGSFSSEPLCLVPCSREAVNDITVAAWSALMSQSATHPNPQLPPEVFKIHCTMSPGPMLDCQQSFVKLVYNLALEIINDYKKNTNTRTLVSVYHRKSFSLKQVQSEVYETIQQCKLPTSIPVVRYLNSGVRPCGKAVDSVDALLIRELKHEEPSWINYDQDEEEVKRRTADEILNMLLDEIVDILCRVHSKKL